MIRVALCVALFVFSALTVTVAASTTSLDSRIRSVTTRHAYAHGAFGGAVYDLDTGRMLYALDSDRYFLAASTTKLLTEGTTLALLGSEQRFQTNVYRSGDIDAGGTLHGDLILRASGDPNISGRVRSDGTLAFENEDHSYDGGPDAKAVDGDPLAVLRSFAQQIADAGIKRVTGRVIVDDTMYAANFPEAGTGAVVSPIMVNDNIVDVVVSPGEKAGDPARFSVSPQTPYTRFVNGALTGAPDSRRTIRLIDNDPDAAGVETVKISGSIALGSKAILYAYDVASPRRFAEMAFTDVLDRSGVRVSQSAKDELPDVDSFRAAYTAANIVAAHTSPPLREDVKVTLKVSDNLHADTMPYLWANGDLHGAFALERRFLQHAGLDPSGMIQGDGLGSDAFVQPQFMVKYLAYLRKQPYYPVIARALPVMGVDGTLFDIETNSPAAGKVFAKTGTWSARDELNGRTMITAKGLAGYMTTRSGRHVAFCFYVNNMPVTGTSGAHVAGEALGELATATYLYTP